MHFAASYFLILFFAYIQISLIIRGGGGFFSDMFPWREETLPRAQKEALISQRSHANDKGKV